MGAALQQLHAAPSTSGPFKVLAEECGTSRSVLAERFQALVGVTPMLYLTQLRMLLAANMLRRSTAPIGQIAEEVGYRTDSAFSRAFRREYGRAPAAWRRGQSSSAAGKLSTARKKVTQSRLCGAINYAAIIPLMID